MGKFRKSCAFLCFAMFSLGAGLVGCNSSSSGGSETPAEDVTYTVTFNSQGGSTVASQTVKHGELATKPADPTKDNYVFLAWYEDSAAVTAFDFTLPITADWTLYAGWKASSTPTPDQDDGDDTDPVSNELKITFDASSIASWSPAPSGFAIHGWNDAGQVTPAWDDGSLAMTSEGNDKYSVSLDSALTGFILRFKQGTEDKQTVDITGTFALGHTYAVTVDGSNWSQNSSGVWCMAATATEVTA